MLTVLRDNYCMVPVILKLSTSQHILECYGFFWTSAAFQRSAHGTVPFQVAIRQETDGAVNRGAGGFELGILLLGVLPLSHVRPNHLATSSIIGKSLYPMLEYSQQSSTLLEGSNDQATVSSPS